jgi:hypothetical protein
MSMLLNRMMQAGGSAVDPIGYQAFAAEYATDPFLQALGSTPEAAHKEWVRRRSQGSAAPSRSKPAAPPRPLANVVEDGIKAADQERVEYERGVARHEAGHAIIAEVLACGVKYVCIGGTEENVNPHCRPDSKNSSLKSRIQVTLAGSLATHDNLDDMSEGDRLNVHRRLELLKMERGYTPQLLAELTEKTRALVRKWSPAIDELASALVRKHKIFGYEVSQIVDRHKAASDPAVTRRVVWPKGSTFPVGKSTYCAKRDTSLPPWKDGLAWRLVA